ncbi:MAG: hypothetical protein B6D34_12350 [Candidatus Brocadia sp. UTAMX1]|nr:MAG: hypothetical protein B6D34_12350 [Candidatus Brocadia sp. UTAMX1]
MSFSVTIFLKSRGKAFVRLDINVFVLITVNASLLHGMPNIITVEIFQKTKLLSFTQFTKQAPSRINPPDSLCLGGNQPI